MSTEILTHATTELIHPPPHHHPVLFVCFLTHCIVLVYENESRYQGKISTKNQNTGRSAAVVWNLKEIDKEVLLALIIVIVGFEEVRSFALQKRNL